MSNDRPTGDPDDSVGSRDDNLLDQVAAHPELARLAFLLAAPPTQRELRGLEGALDTFRASVPHTKPRRPSLIATFAGAKLAATIAGISVGLGGAATVAYVSAAKPPTPDASITAPATAPARVSAPARSEVPATRPATPTRSTSSAGQRSGDSPKQGTVATGAPAGPDVSGPAAHGLCTAWGKAARNGKPKDSVAFRNLIEAAGGEDKVDAFCAKVDAPAATKDRATAKPKAVPTGKSSSAPTAPDAKPDTVPTASPSHPTGRP
jgi:hypothetical protein